ncbi:MAG: class I SAM-dependent methyltransferase [Pseudomonadota bacterium]
MRLTQQAHAALAKILTPGDHAIDATCGNGYDTCFVAQQVGPTGRVLGIDIQPEAIRATRGALEQAGCSGQSILVQDSHANMMAIADEHGLHAPMAVMFNLGYLPGTDKRITTTVDTTIQALNAARALLAPGGALSVMSYRGHSEGAHEHAAVVRWCQSAKERGDTVQQRTAPANGPVWSLVIKPRSGPA